MNRKLFLDIVMVVSTTPTSSARKIVPAQLVFPRKCTAALRMLVYGASADTQDGYRRMSESITQECMYMFCRAVVTLFVELYL
jgi:hypothetical protein